MKEKLMPCDYKHYSNYSVEKKKELRIVMARQKEMLKEQRRLIETSLLAAINERIQLTDKFLHNEVHLDYYIKRQEYLGKYVQGFFKEASKIK
jgi:hypothetical protein